MAKSILIRITAYEDYDDVHDEILLDDFVHNPKGFNIELVVSKQDTPSAVCSKCGETPVCKPHLVCYPCLKASPEYNNQEGEAK